MQVDLKFAYLHKLSHARKCLAGSRAETSLAVTGSVVAV